MIAPVRVRALQWALVWAVAMAVVGMHHLSTHEQSSHPMTGMTNSVGVECCQQGQSSVDMVDQHAPAPGGQHDMVHLCLAILCALLGLGVILMAMRRRAIADLFGSLVAQAARPRSPPPPPRGVPERLATLCVLRL